MLAGLPLWFSLAITVVGLLAPRLAERCLHGAAVVDRGANTQPVIDAQLLALPIHVLSFDVVGDAGAIIVLLATVILIGVSGWWMFARGGVSSLRVLLGVQALAGTVLALAPVSLSPDPTAYIIYSRLYGVFGANPYRVPLELPAHDGILSLVAPLWGTTVPSNVYGPLWTLLTAGIAHVQGDASLTVLWVTQRLIAVAAGVGTTLGLLRLMKRIGTIRDALPRAAAFAFHPFVLLETAVNGHNDMVMVACAVWAFALVEEAPLAAGLALGASIAVKFVSVVLVPFFLLLAWRAHEKRMREVVGASCAICVAFAVPFVPFWIGLRTLLPLRQNQSGVDVSLAALLSDWYLGFARAAAEDPVFPGQRHWRILRHATSGQLIDLVLIGLWLALALVLLYRFAQGGGRGNIYLALTSCIWVLPSVGSYYLIWLSPILAEGTRWGCYVRWLLASAMLYYLQSFMGKLPWERTADIYILALLLVPLLPFALEMRTRAKC